MCETHVFARIQNTDINVILCKHKRFSWKCKFPFSQSLSLQTHERIRICHDTDYWNKCHIFVMCVCDSFLVSFFYSNCRFGPTISILSLSIRKWHSAVCIASANLLTRGKTTYFSISSIFIWKKNFFHTHKTCMCGEGTQKGGWGGKHKERYMVGRFEWWMDTKWQICKQIYSNIHLFVVCVFVSVYFSHLSLIFTLTASLSLLQVSWIRRRDYHLLTVSLTTYSSDERYSVSHAKHSEVSIIARHFNWWFY